MENNNTPLTGLTSDEVRRRTDCGLDNSGGQIPAKSVKDIIRTNVFTFFNLINVCLAAAVIAVGSFESALFMGVILWNVLIGIAQEVRAKRITDKLTLISQPEAVVIRDGKESRIDYRGVVSGDLLKLSAGMQVCADCEVRRGECEVNESLVTGESDPLLKTSGGTLLSGSFIVSGEVYAQTVRVGADSFANKITQGARFLKKPSSKMFRSMDRIVKGISVIILPIMALLFYQSLFVLGEPLETAVISVVAAVIGMIPEGLVLLISIVMAVGSIRLARHNALVQDMYCIETLARVDVLCLDKTGTITKGDMQVEEVVLLDDGFTMQGICETLGAFIGALPDVNPTAGAIRARFPKTADSDYEAVRSYPFSGAKKWSGVYFKGKGSYVLGAAEFVLRDNMPDELSAKVKSYSGKGKRVVLFANSRFDFNGKDLPVVVMPLALIIISDSIREQAPDTLKFFAENDVEIKIISGDDPVTVMNVARQAGVKNAANYIDMSEFGGDIGKAALKYTVFGRVNPSQKLDIIKACKSNGHTVAMTGDGVNDVLALKNADCSIAMQSGSDAARNVSDIVLLDSDFSSIPKIVKEGRRSINNVERSAVLFLTKTVFSLIIGIAYIFLAKPYPLVPIQMTLVNALFIGIPSFLLALEPNTGLVRGGFIENVLKKAIPYGFCHVACILIMTALAHVYRLTPEQIRGIAVIILGTTSLLILASLCRPFNKRRAAMVVLLGAAFCLAVGIFERVLEITDYTLSMLLILSSLFLASFAVVWYFPIIGGAVVNHYKKRGRKNKSGQ